MKVTRENFPHLHKAFELISHDRGSQAGHRWYEIPDTFIWRELRLGQIDCALGQLGSEEFETFCIGEESMKTMILALNGSSWIYDADELLTEFFESDWPCDDGN